eukprot:SM000823S22591  [mRNA]  locus=s823:819:2075:- [translate_table: standard]
MPPSPLLGMGSPGRQSAHGESTDSRTVLDSSNPSCAAQWLDEGARSAGPGRSLLQEQAMLAAASALHAGDFRQAYSLSFHAECRIDPNTDIDYTPFFKACPNTTTVYTPCCPVRIALLISRAFVRLFCSSTVLATTNNADCGGKFFSHLQRAGYQQMSLVQDCAQLLYNFTSGKIPCNATAPSPVPRPSPAALAPPNAPPPPAATPNASPSPTNISPPPAAPPPSTAARLPRQAQAIILGLLCTLLVISAPLL